MVYGRARRGPRRTSARRSFARKRSYQARSFAATRIQRAVRNVKKRFQRAKIQRAVRPLLETKVRQFVLFGDVSLTGTILPKDVPGAGLGSGMVNTGGLYTPNLWPNFAMTLGDKQFERIGMKIQNCRLTATVCATVNPYAAASNSSQYSCDLFMIVLRDKIEKSCIPDQLKLQQNGTTYYIDGTAQNAFLPFNRDKYTVYSCKKIARFRPPPRLVRSTPTATPGDTLENPQFSQGIAYRNLRVSLPCPKNLNFTPVYGGTTTAPVDIAPQNASLAVGFFWLDGSGNAYTSAEKPVKLSCTLKLTYTDA